MRRTILLLSVTVAIVFSVGGGSLAAGQLDQQQTSVSSGIGMDATYPMAQTFTAGSSGSLDAVSVHAAREGTTEAGDMLLSIQSLDEAGRPSGTVLGSGSAPIEAFNASPPNSWVDVDLAQPAQVRTGEGYALVATTENTTPTGSSFYSWSMAFNDPHPGGDAHDRSEGEWGMRTDAGVPVDFAFKTFVVPDTTAPRVVAATPGGGRRDAGRRRVGSRARRRRDRHPLREDGPRHHHGFDLQALQGQPRQVQDAYQRHRHAPRHSQPGRAEGRDRPPSVPPPKPSNPAPNTRPSSPRGPGT